MQNCILVLTEMQFTVRNNRRLVIVQLCVRYVQLAAVSGQ
jgi:hypothetical protein